MIRSSFLNVKLGQIYFPPNTGRIESGFIYRVTTLSAFLSLCGGKRS